MARNPILACAFLLASLLICGCGERKGVVVGAKNFTEQLILGEIISQQVERCAGVPVERRLNLGGTLLAHQAIVSGEIDIYPEYSGTALTSVLNEAPRHDAAAVLARVREEYLRRWGVRWLDSLGFENTFAMAIPEALAERNALRTLSDAARSGIGWSLGVGYEFEERPDGLPGLLQTYPLKLESAPRTMDLGLLYSAIGQGQVNMVAANSTDGMLEAMRLRVLEDDRRFFPPYEAAILVREETLGRIAGLRGCLESLSGKFSETRMRALNLQADRGETDLRTVATEAISE